MKTPKRFVGLHNHTGFSPYDGLGYPHEHFKYCIENGLDAHAITEHGNCNSLAHAALWVEDWNKNNADKQFKYLPGVEAYFIPDLEQWNRDKLAAEEATQDKKVANKLKSKQEALQTKIIDVVDENDEVQDIELTNALTIEDEEESKSAKNFDPVKRRHHLVLLPKNQNGLLKLYHLVSKSYLYGFYRFPRIDTKVLREAASSGDLVVSAACLAGLPSFNVFQELQKTKFDKLEHSLLDDRTMLERCVAAVGNAYEMMTDAVGRDNYYLELQFNRLPAQNLVNRAILEFANRNGLDEKLIVTCDAHYARPELWRERELYKQLGFMNYREYSPDNLPKSRDELKCELYPKNAEQVWGEYLKSKKDTSFYDAETVCRAIERTHDIAHRVIGDTPQDKSPKFPTKKLVPEGTTPFKHLVKLCKEGMVKRGLEEKQEYVARLREELEVIKAMSFAGYFVSYQKIMELARGVNLVGPGRGSGAGCLVNYVLYITDLDPVKWDLPFSRFLNIYRKGNPDIDCLRSDHLVNTPSGVKVIRNLCVGDEILDHDGEIKKVTFVASRPQRKDELCFELLLAKEGTYGTLVASENHRLLNNNGNEVSLAQIQVGDDLFNHVKVAHKRVVSITGLLTDISIQNTHTFQCVPFDVIEFCKDQSQCLIHVDTYLNEVQEDFDYKNCWRTWI